LTKAFEFRSDWASGFPTCGIFTIETIIDYAVCDYNTATLSSVMSMTSMLTARGVETDPAARTGF
jgi:hypothetical protein